VSAERTVTRSIAFSLREIQQGTAVLPPGVTYLVLPTGAAGSTRVLGEFPHAPMGADCPAALLVRVKSHEYEPWCTRLGEHDLHVAHIAPGQPIAAWTDAS